jgi:acyl carrier protein
MSNRDKLKLLLMDVFILTEADFRFDLKREEILTWDSLGIVSMAVGVQETFNYHLTPQEAMGVTGVQDIIRILESKGIPFSE